MTVELVGANPRLTLFDAAGNRTAYASVWQVDWSTHGAGRALVLWHAGRVRLLTDAPGLGRWLADSFVRHFPEVDGLAWPEPEVQDAAVDWHLDLTAGFRVTAADVVVGIDGPLDHRVAAVEAFALGPRTCGFSTVFVPCRAGTIDVAGARVDGVPRVDGRTSTAFLAVAEVWTDPATG